MRSKEPSINRAIHCDEEIYSGATRLIKAQDFIDMNFKIKTVLEAIVCEKKRQILQDNLTRNGINV